MNTTQLERLMRLSWEIQRKHNISRAKALVAAWAIMQNDETTIHYLVQKHRTNRANPAKQAQGLALFK